MNSKFTSSFNVNDYTQEELLKMEFEGRGKVEQYKVFATMTTTLYIDVYASSKEDATNVAKKRIDRGEFVEVEERGEWNIYDATPADAY